MTIPRGINEGEVRARLLEEHNLEIGAGLGQLAGKIWRIGLMGNSSNGNNVMLCLNALASVLKDMQASVEPEDVLASAAESIS